MNALHVIVWLNVTVFVVQYLFGVWMQEVVVGDGESKGIALVPYGALSLQSLSEGRFWTVVTYMFVHGSVLHVVVNLIMIWFAGRRVLALLGQKAFLQIYFFSGMTGAAMELLLKATVNHDTTTPLVGASAAAFGLLTALAVMLPYEQITAMIYFIIPVNMRLWTMAMIFVGFEVFLGVVGLFWPEFEMLKVAHFAHVGGALTGWYYMKLLGYDGNVMTFERLHRERAQSPFMRRPAMARTRKLGVNLEVDVEAARKKTSGDATVDMIREEVDPILDKISDFGISSLTEEERRILERASREISRKSGS
jgi:membrane associated rhomboid family serine protease